jgi:hypothetical protein
MVVEVHERRRSDGAVLATHFFTLTECMQDALANGYAG